MSAPDTPDTADNAALRGAPPSPMRWWTLGIVTIATFMLMLDLTVVNVALPKLRVTLNASFSDLQWVIDAYVLTLSVFLLTGGALADRLGRKKIFIGGFAVFTAASLACGLANSISVLNISRGVQGFGAAILFAVGPALIGQEFHGKERGGAFGIFGGGAGLAIAFGPLIGGALTDGISWRWIFLLNVPIGVVAIALSIVRLRESRDRRAVGGVGDIDWFGLVTFSASATLLVLALLRGNADGWTSATVLGFFVGAAVALALFLVIERTRGPKAMLDLSLYRVPTFNGISVAAVVMGATAMSGVFLLVSYTQNVLGYSPFATGVRFLPMTFVLFVVAGVTGSLTAKLPQRIMVTASMVFTGVGLLTGRTLIHVYGGWTGLLAIMVLFGIGMGIFNPARAFLSIGVVEPRQAGMSSGMNETFQQVGMGIGIAAFGAMFQARVTSHFVHAAVPGQAGAVAHQAGAAISAGSLNEVVASVPASVASQTAAAARAAFVNGMNDVFVVSGIVTLVGAIFALAFIRRADLHASALEAPGVLPDVYEEEEELAGSPAPA